MKDLLHVFVIFTIIVTVSTKSFVKRDLEEEEDDDEGLGLGSFLQDVVNEMNEVIQSVDKDLEDTINEMTEGDNIDDLPKTYDNSTSQTEKLNDTVSVQTNSTIHRENKNGEEDTIIQKNQVMTNNKGEVIGEKQAVMEIVDNGEDDEDDDDDKKDQEKYRGRKPGSHLFKRV